MRMNVRIRQLREARRMSQADLAKMLHVEPTTISRYENGHRNITLQAMADIAEALRVDIKDLLPSATGPAPDEHVIRIPILGQVKEMLLDRHLIAAVNYIELRGLEVADDSMAPTLKKGDLVVIDTSQHEVTVPGIYAIHLGGGAYSLKRAERGPKGVVNFRSDNVAYGSFDLAPGDHIDIAGRVIWVGKQLN